MSRLGSLKSLSLTTIMAGTLALSGAGVATAQQEETAPAHPVHIHEGTCDDLNPTPAQPLNNITPWVNVDPEDESANQPQGALTAPGVLRSETEVEMPLEDLLASSYAINAHESEENIENYIACGVIGGVVVEDDGQNLAVALMPVNNSGYNGIAFLEGGGDTTTVQVWLTEPMDPQPAATPAA